MNILRRIKRAICWELRHISDNHSLETYSSGEIGSRFKKYRCSRCKEYFWQFGEISFIQVHEDPRLGHKAR